MRRAALSDSESESVIDSANDSNSGLENNSRTGILLGLASALLFALSTPVAKVLLQSTSPLMLAALFYCGSGLGLALVAAWRRYAGAAETLDVNEPSINRSELPWLIPAIICGGILAPISMMKGLSLEGAAASSMLLNLEGVFTAALAWVVFKENVDRRVFTGMVCILLGGGLLSVGKQFSLEQLDFAPGSLAIVLACLLWAADNNFCRKVSTSDSVLVAMSKGLIAGGVNLAIAFSCGEHLPKLPVAAAALTVGFLSYGLSLVCYLTAQRFLGTARTGAYFASAPFIAAVLAIVILHEPMSQSLAAAAVLMITGLYLHLTEHHSHDHQHEEVEHSHMHVHDLHHQHEHEDGQDVHEPHTHKHKHERMVHSHEHYPDSHHEHTH